MNTNYKPDPICLISFSPTMVPVRRYVSISLVLDKTEVQWEQVIKVTLLASDWAGVKARFVWLKAVGGKSLQHHFVLTHSRAHKIFEAKVN